MKAKLQRRARRHGVITEEEVRNILRNAVADAEAPPLTFGTAFASHFAEIGLEEDILELRGQEPRPADFGPADNGS